MNCAGLAGAEWPCHYPGGPLHLLDANQELRHHRGILGHQRAELGALRHRGVGEDRLTGTLTAPDGLAIGARVRVVFQTLGQRRVPVFELGEG